MPIIKSAQKRVRSARKATIRNLRTKRHLKSAIKTVRKAVDTGKKSSGKEFSEAMSAIDKAVKKGIIHKNKAARQKSRLAAAFKKSGGKITASAAKTAKKTVSKPTPAKKTQAKSAAKKPASKTKKPAAKKTSSKK